jgi:N-methylhydantoinase A/oxoprolinase/acetone carboxylase beta subunit
VPLAIGVDTGGTYTDAVLFDRVRGVLAGAKALTTRDNLAIGIGEAVARVLPAVTGTAAESISFLSVSTTLATNALAEHTGSQICVVLLGYPDHVLDRPTAEQAFGEDPVVHLAGGHTVEGDEQEPLDLEGLRRTAREYGDRVKAFAVSGYFSVRNPEHEYRAREVLHDMTGLPVSCGHELSSRLHAGRRALTTAWNARLIPLLTDLVAAVRQVMAAQDLTCPLMVVKGDGSLVSAERAREHPVQTILSGPAASVVGAQYLHGLEEACVVDIGGTTTDIAFVRNGRPVVSEDGAHVGGLRTMVPAVHMHTFALGGDSAIELTAAGGVAFGPGRIVPVSLAAHQQPETIGEIEADLAAARDAADPQADEPSKVRMPGTPVVAPGSGQFVRVRERGGAMTDDAAAGGGGMNEAGMDAAGMDMRTLSASQESIIEAARKGYVSCRALIAGSASAYRAERDLHRLLRRGFLTRCGLTPSDAAHVLGRQDSWDREAAVLAVLGFYHRARDRGVVLVPEGPAADAAAADAAAADAGGDAAGSGGDLARATAERLVALFVAASARALLEAAITEMTGGPVDRKTNLATVLLDDAVNPPEVGNSPVNPLDSSPPEVPAIHKLVNTTVQLGCPIIAVGAPAACYYTDVARTLHTTAVIPRHAEVANAIGAVVGEVRTEVTVRVVPVKGGDFLRVHLPTGTEDYESLEEAEAVAVRAAEEEVHRQALAAGAEEFQVTLDHHRTTSEVEHGEMLIELAIHAVAIGRPRLG